MSPRREPAACRSRGLLHVQQDVFILPVRCCASGLCAERELQEGLTLERAGRRAGDACCAGESSRVSFSDPKESGGHTGEDTQRGESLATCTMTDACPSLPVEFLLPPLREDHAISTSFLEGIY